MKVGSGVLVDVEVTVAPGVGDSTTSVEVYVGFTSVGEGKTVSLEGRLPAVGVAAGVFGSSVIPKPTSVLVARGAIAVIFGVRIITVESRGGKVGIAPQEDNITVIINNNKPLL